MTNIELQEQLKKFNADKTVCINSSNNFLSNINNQRLDFIQIYDNNFDDNEVDRIEESGKNIYLSFSRESLIIPQVYYFYLKWREFENISLKNKIYSLSSTYLSGFNIDRYLMENKINCLSALNSNYSFLSGYTF